MYSTCIFCHAGLGANKVIEPFPVGRRLAFDAVKGRLWVVCRQCERWNLTPLEERWEAIEECERLFRGTKMRMSTDNVGLARLREGLELVRIGAPLRPEMAAWRYGDQFARRRNRQLAAGMGLVATGAAALVVGPLAGLATIGTLSLLDVVNLGRILYNRSAWRTRLRVSGAKRPVVVQEQHLKHVMLIHDDNPDGWGLYVPISHGLASPFDAEHPPDPSKVKLERRWSHSHAVFVGDEALGVARRLLPKINRGGGRRSDVQDAVKYLEEVDDPHLLFVAQARRVGPLHSEPLRTYAAPVRLALEMVTHEDVERRALAGELALLEAAWQEAEVVAKISDDLFVVER